MRESAGVVLYRRLESLEVLLVHPGGPYWARKDLGVWSIPKGECHPGEDPLAAAQRELQEEVGCRVVGDFMPLAPVRQAGGKIVSAWAVEGDADTSSIRSNAFRMEWPPHSGYIQEFPEVDRAQWFPIDVAISKINPGQRPLLDELAGRLEDTKRGTR